MEAATPPVTRGMFFVGSWAAFTLLFMMLLIRDWGEDRHFLLQVLRNGYFCKMGSTALCPPYFSAMADPQVVGQVHRALMTPVAGVLAAFILTTFITLIGRSTQNDE